MLTLNRSAELVEARLSVLQHAPRQAQGYGDVAVFRHYGLLASLPTLTHSLRGGG